MARGDEDKAVGNRKRATKIDLPQGLSIARIMADKVYTSAEYKRERDNFHALCKDLEHAEVKKWLTFILEVLRAKRAKDQYKDGFDDWAFSSKSTKRSFHHHEDPGHGGPPLEVLRLR